jgi:hypothetical protein
VVLKALAKLVFDFGFSARRPDNADELLEILLNGITDIDFSHDNPMWRYFDLAAADRESMLPGLSSYLAATDGSTNRDIGAYQGGFMRFGAKHNDIYPILGDMIRWKLALLTPSPNPEPVLVRESSCPAWGWKGFSDEEATQRRADREPASTG